ncbi:MAG: hypothetical protein ACK4K2_01040 [Dehalococcoidia bacterium]
MKRLSILLVVAVAAVSFLAGSLWGGRLVTPLKAATLRQEPGPQACLQMMQGQGMEQCQQFHQKCHDLMGSQGMEGMHGVMMGAGMTGMGMMGH